MGANKPPSVGTSALIGALLGGGLGAGASALSSAEKRPNETREARMKRILRNALIGGGLGAGAGGSGGALLGMVPRINNPKSLVEKWRDMPWNIGHPATGALVGYGAGNQVSAAGRRSARLGGLLDSALNRYDALLSSPQGVTAQNALAKPQALPEEKAAVDALWNRIIGSFDLSKSHKYASPPAAGSMEPVPMRDEMKAILSGLLTRSKTTTLPGGKPFNTFVDAAARKSAPDFSRYDFPHAPTKMDRLKYEVKSTVSPTKSGIVGALIGLLGPTVLSRLGTAISNLRE